MASKSRFVGRTAVGLDVLVCTFTLESFKLLALGLTQGASSVLSSVELCDVSEVKLDELGELGKLGKLGDVRSLGFPGRSFKAFEQELESESDVVELSEVTRLRFELIFLNKKKYRVKNDNLIKPTNQQLKKPINMYKIFLFIFGEELWWEHQGLIQYQTPNVTKRVVKV